MQRDTFDSFVSHPEGQIFLLNLLDSLELGLLPRETLGDYSARLDSVPGALSQRPWLDAVTDPAGATDPPALEGAECFVTVVPMRRADLAVAVPFDELVGDSLVPGRVVHAPVAKMVFLRRQTRKHTWVTDARAVAAASGPDELRDTLGLDWVPQEADLFVLELNEASVRAAGPRRPTGLCRGSARFRARRDDEAGHASYRQWGFTVHLAKWRDAAPEARVEHLAGAPELLVGLGPIDASTVQARYVGATQDDSGCEADSDHRRFARHLNLGEAVDADHLYARLSRILQP